MTTDKAGHQSEIPSTEFICNQVRDVLVNGPKTVLDDVLVGFLRGYMKAINKGLRNAA